MKEVIQYGNKILEFFSEIWFLLVALRVLILVLWAFSFTLCYRVFVPEVFGLVTALVVSFLLSVMVIVIIMYLIITLVSIFMAGNPNP
jgi:uncharacterized BrkB/YihY/UPF0761 family membrane protein